jgi:hypothetical protein
MRAVARMKAILNALNLCNAQICVDYLTNWSRDSRWGWDVEVSMRYLDVAPSRLPSLLLPCPHCGHRMLIATVEPTRLADGAAARDLQEVTHSCVQCGTRLTRTIRSLSGAA